MAPPREPWAVLNELPRRLKNWLTRPPVNFEATADNGSGASSAFPSAEDSSDLLRRRMEALHLDPDDVDRPTAQLAGIVTGLCAHCAARGKCMRDLDDEFADPGWGDWRNYCPNATTLTILSTLGNCVENQQQQQHDEDNASGATPWRRSASGGTFSQA
jgi:hypothetical protein